MLKKWFLTLTFLALSMPGLAACNAPNPPQTVVSANTPRAVTFPTLRTGGRTTLVYFLMSSSSRTSFTGVLRSYDTATQKNSDVLRLPNVKIEEAQISADGQWILYVAYVVDHDELRVVRADGRYAQTLLSAPPYAGLSNAQWSPDQKLIAFAEQPPQTGPQVIYLLDLAHRHLQSELTSTSQSDASQYVARKWLDETRLLVTDMTSNVQGFAFQHIALLDSRKGANQQLGNLQMIYSTSSQCGDFEISADATQLFILRCSSVSFAGGSSTIIAQPLNGGSSHTVFYSSTFFSTQIRQLTPQILLLIGDRAVWSIHSDGTGLKQFFSTNDQHGRANFCAFSRYPWSNFARDGSMLALETIEIGVDTHSSALVIGSSAGGALQIVASSYVGLLAPGSDIYLVGWTAL